MQSCLGRIRHKKEVSLHFHMPERATRYLDSWWCIKKGRVELETVRDRIFGQGAPEQTLVNVETYEQDT